jgi:hypothetical protein
MDGDQALPHVRILTFGYDANVVDPSSRGSLNSLFEHSINLLNELSQKGGRIRRAFTVFRFFQTNLSTTTIFVAYSLGGLIVKDVSRLDFPSLIHV